LTKKQFGFNLGFAKEFAVLRHSFCSAVWSVPSAVPLTLAKRALGPKPPFLLFWQKIYGSSRTANKNFGTNTGTGESGTASKNVQRPTTNIQYFHKYCASNAARIAGGDLEPAGH
jgi:hypothetical protein